MRFPRISIAPHFLREVFGNRTLMREPEPSLVMDEVNEAKAFDEAGRANGALTAVYVFNVGHISQAIMGCKKVLDLGCGPANQLIMLARLHPEIEFLGVDLSQSMLDIAQKSVLLSGLKNIKFQLMDMSSLDDLADESMDAVISTVTLHHLPSLGHLDLCFKNIKRVLKKNGCICLIDLGRLKSLKSVIYFSYRDAASLPYLFNLDFERSLRAAFRLEDFQELAKKYFGDKLQVIGTFKAPLFILTKTKDQPLPQSIKDELKRLRLKIPTRFRDDLDDMRVFFFLSGLKNDPFGAFLLGDDFFARIRMAQFIDLPIMYQILTSRFSRFAVLTVAISKIFFVGLSAKFVKFFFPRSAHKIHKANLWSHRKIGKILNITLSRLKGPLMKLGQMASYLSLEVPELITEALKPLQSMSDPIDGKVIRRIVERELGKPITELFSEWRDLPIAAASISQLHYARLPNGNPVIVKIRYPGIKKCVQSDLKNLKLFSGFLSKFSGLSNFHELLSELEKLILDECQFQKAADFQEEFRHLFKNNPNVIIPKVHRQYCTNEILTMDYVDGKDFSEFKATASQSEKNNAAKIIWQLAGESINRYCIYNADPHPGNYLFVDGKVCFLDFGFTKRFSPKFMDLWKQQTLAGCANDLQKFSEINLQLGYVTNEATFDHKMMLEIYQNIIYQAWKEDRIFKFEKSFVDQELKALLKLFKSQQGNRMPVEFVTILRLLWGQHALLADLNAEANWHEIVFPLFFEKSDSKTNL